MKPTAQEVPISAEGPELDRLVLREAARWLVRLNAGNAQPADWQALAMWRAQHPAHELAWQRAERLGHMLHAVPGDVGVSVLSRVQRRVSRRATLQQLALAAVVPTAGYLAWRHASQPEWLADYRTAVGEQRSVTLADGTRVQLNTATALDVSMDEGQRLLRLQRGEIQVITAPQERRLAVRERPLLVETVHGRLGALGTRFVLRQTEPGESVVAVSEGSVEITPRRGRMHVLHAGQQCVFTGDSVQHPVPLAEHLLAWVQGVLYADGMRLDAFAGELSRYRRGWVRCDPAVAGLRISGAFRLDDTDYILTMLRETLPIQVVSRTRYWITLVPV